MKRLLTIACIIAAGLMIYLFFVLPLKKNYDAKSVDIRGIYLLNPIKIANFELTDQNGNPFTKANLANHWSFLFFGFTHCDMVCPVTLSSLNQFYQRIENNKPQIVFITIDPENDTTERLKKYLLQFNPQFIGARTSLEKTIELKKEFHIVAEKVRSSAGYTNQYDHSSEILLINPNVEIQAYFFFPPDPKRLEKDYLAILKHNHLI